MTMGRRACGVRLVAAAVGVLTTALAASSLAAVTRFQATGDASVGVSDNPQSAPDEPLPGGTTKSPGVFFVLRPGLALGSLAATNVQRLSYTFDYNLFLARSATSSSSNRLEYRGFFDFGPSVNAIVGAAATESDSYAALTLAPPASGLLPLLPSGTSRLLTLSADELFNFQLSVGWRTWESLGIVYATPIFGTDAPETLSPNARLGLEYAWRADALGVEGRGYYTIIHNGVRPDGTRVDTDREISAGGVAQYRHDIGRYFTTNFEGGAMHVTRLSSKEGHVYPIAGVRLGYADIYGDAQLSYAHTLATNILLGQTQLADEVRLRGAIPLDKKAIFNLAASAGYQLGRLLDENARTAANISVLTADVTFGWQLNPWLLVGVRAQHIDQRSDVRVPWLPISFVQNNVMLGASVHFPPDAAVPSTYRAPQRVDRSDELRGTARPSAESIAAPTGRAR